MQVNVATTVLWPVALSSTRAGLFGKQSKTYSPHRAPGVQFDGLDGMNCCLSNKWTQERSLCVQQFTKPSIETLSQGMSTIKKLEDGRSKTLSHLTVWWTITNIWAVWTFLTSSSSIILSTRGLTGGTRHCCIISSTLRQPTNTYSTRRCGYVSWAVHGGGVQRVVWSPKIVMWHQEEHSVYPNLWPLDEETDSKWERTRTSDTATKGQQYYKLYKKRTIWKCGRCNVALCLVAHTNCFSNWHSGSGSQGESQNLQEQDDPSSLIM